MDASTESGRYSSKQTKCYYSFYNSAFQHATLAREKDGSTITVRPSWESQSMCVHKERMISVVLFPTKEENEINSVVLR